MAVTKLDIVFKALSFIGFILVAVGFGTTYWFFSETDRWQFKCDLRTCCVRDIDPTPQLWTCWPIKDPPKLYRIGELLASCGLGLWLPAIICLVAVRAKYYHQQATRLALCFLMLSGGSGVIGCKIMFRTAEEYFIIAEVPGVSGYMVLWGFTVTLVGSVLASLWMIVYAADQILTFLGKVIGCIAALLFLPLRAALLRVYPLWARLMPHWVRLRPLWLRLKPTSERISAACVRFASFSKRSLISISVRLKSAFLCVGSTTARCASPVICLLRPAFLPIFAFAVLVFTAVFTFVQTKLAAISTYALTKLAALLIVCSPRLYALVESLCPLLSDRTALFEETHRFGLRQRDTLVIYLVGLVKPSFDLTLKFMRARTSKAHKIKISKAVPLNGVVVH